MEDKKVKENSNDLDKIKNFEKKMIRLEDIVSKLEGTESTLEDSVLLFKEGMKLANECRGTLDNIESIISVATVEGSNIKREKLDIDDE